MIPKSAGPAARNGEARKHFQDHTPLLTAAPSKAQALRHRRFGPHVIAIARFITDVEEVPPDDVIGFFREVDRRWPGLLFSDFFGACVLAEALALKTEGNA